MRAIAPVEGGAVGVGEGTPVAVAVGEIANGVIAEVKRLPVSVPVPENAMKTRAIPPINAITVAARSAILRLPSS